jgi:coenzyme F420-reducing hydrogenase alpha subunit
MHEADLDLDTDGIPADDEATTSYAIRQLTRVEGEGRLDLSVRDGVVTRARLEIFEAPRYFERLVVGRDPNEVIDIVARICGICPVAYQMSAVHAFEDLFGVAIDPSVRALRRLFYCGEWIESHALHVYLLHAPDFLGYPSAVEMAADHPAIVERGLRLKKVGNRIVGILGGRPIHPVSVRVGGFSRAPSRAELAPLRTDLDTALADALETVRWAATLDPPAGEREPRLVALRHPTEYPMNDGRITSSDGIDVKPGAWTDAFAEHQVPWSNALQARARDGVPYLLGPTARVSLAGDQLHPIAREALAATGLGDALRTSVFRSIVARGVELVHAVAEARDLVDGYAPPAQPHADWTARPGVAAWATEAPRGLLFHRYEVDERGLVRHAQIVPPTSQNQAAIEHDLTTFAPSVLDLPHAEATRRLEQLIRSYDPCISCATHFLDLHVERG